MNKIDVDHLFNLYLLEINHKQNNHLILTTEATSDTLYLAERLDGLLKMTNTVILLLFELVRLEQEMGKR
jgi:hypothetical protein